MDELPLGWDLIRIETALQLMYTEDTSFEDKYKLSPLTCFEISIFLTLTNCLEGCSRLVNQGRGL